MDVFTLVGKMTIDGLDKTKGQLSGLEKNVQKVQKGMKILGAAFTAVGVAGLAMVASSKKMNAQLGVTALNLGITTKEMRDLALATTNVTFPIKEVIDTFDLLARAGIKDKDILQSVATAFDTLGDATGKTASQVTKMMIPAMKTFGLTAEEIAEKTDLMTFMTRNTTLSLDDFNTMVGYTTPELVKQGLSIEDLTAGLIFMEKQGYAPGRVMTREFMKATTLAAREQIPLTEALGMTSEELEEYKTQMAGATGLTQKYADVANEQFTIMDKLKQKWSELTLGASAYLEPLEPILAGMTALGPLMIALSTSAGIATLKWIGHTAAVVASAIAHPIQTATLIASKVAMFASAVALKAVTIAQWAWNAAMTANPIGLIIVGIVALIAAGVLLWKNWDMVTEFMKKSWSNIKAFFLEGVLSVLGTLVKFTSFLGPLGDKVQEAHDAIAGMIDTDKVVEDARRLQIEIEKLADEMVETVREQLEEERDLKLKAVQESKDLAQEEYGNRISELQKTYGVLEREDENYQETRMDAARRATDEMRKQYDRDVDAARQAYDEKIRLIDAEFTARLKLLDEETAAIISEYQERIDAIDAQTEAEELAAKEAQRVKRLAELEGAVESAGTEDERLKAIDKLEEYQAKVDRERLLEGRRAEKEALRDQIEDTRKAASQERDRLRTELEEKKTHEKELFEALEARLEEEKEALDKALEAELVRIDDERIAAEKAAGEIRDDKLEKLGETEKALVTHYETQLTETNLHVAAINAATKEIVDREVTITITTVHEDVYVSSGSPGGASGDGEIVGAQGGIALRETIVRVAEQGPRIPEALIPLSKEAFEKAGLISGGPSILITGNTFNVRDEDDIDKIAEELVDRIRLRTGVRI